MLLGHALHCHQPHISWQLIPRASSTDKSILAGISVAVNTFYNQSVVPVAKGIPTVSGDSKRPHAENRGSDFQAIPLGINDYSLYDFLATVISIVIFD
jgi:hypothetical protein